MSLRLMYFGFISTLLLIISIPASADDAVITPDRNQESVLTGHNQVLVNVNPQNSHLPNNNSRFSKKYINIDIEGHRGPAINPNQNSKRSNRR
jgi:hypothetical protein